MANPNQSRTDSEQNKKNPSFNNQKEYNESMDQDELETSGTEIDSDPTDVEETDRNSNQNDQRKQSSDMQKNH